MDVDVGVHESNDTKMEVEEDTAIDGKEKNRVRMAMQKTRKDAEYREKESEPIVVEVEDVPLEEDQEFRTTILSPESNLRPTGDEWIMPVVLFPEPADQLEKNRVRIRMALQNMRKDAEYRKTERATDSASKKRKWDIISQEEKDEINRKKRERAKVRRAEEKKKRAEQDQEKTPQELEEDKRMAEEEKRKAISSDPFAHRSQAFKEKEQELEKLCVNSGTTYELPHVGESQYQTSKRRARLNQLCDEDGVKDVYDEHGVPIIKLTLRESIAEAKEKICRTFIGRDANGEQLHQAPVCVICDEVIIGCEPICYLRKDQILKHQSRLGIDAYNEAHGRVLPNSLVAQYEIHDMKGLLLSPRAPRAPRDADKFMTCGFCNSGMKSRNASNNKPPKLAIANGFAIGSIPDVLQVQGENGTQKCTSTIDASSQKSKLVDVIFAAISPVRPYAYIYSYNGGQHKTIQGNFQFFETDQTKISGALKHLQSSGIRSNIYIVITGAMTPTQKQIVSKKTELDKALFLDLLAWFKENHPGYEGVDIDCPEIPLIKDPDSPNNTDEEGDINIETTEEEGATYYFTSGTDPTKETSVYQTSKKLALSLLKGTGAPTLTVHGGNYANHSQVMALENVMTRQFPYGSGGPTLKRRTDISDEAILRHYLRLSLSQFMRAEFVLLSYSILNRILSYKSALIKCRPIVDDNGTAAAEAIAKMTVSQIEAAMKQDEDGTPVLEQNNSHATTFLKAVSTSCRSMGHTKEAAQYARRKCFALQDYFSMHSLFFTITVDDECSFRIRLYANAGEKVSHITVRITVYPMSDV